MNYYIYITCINLCLPGFPFHNRNIWLYFNIDFNIQPSHILPKRISVPFYTHTRTYAHTLLHLSPTTGKFHGRALYTRSIHFLSPSWLGAVCAFQANSPGWRPPWWRCCQVGWPWTIAVHLNPSQLFATLIPLLSGKFSMGFLSSLLSGLLLAV